MLHTAGKVPPWSDILKLSKALSFNAAADSKDCSGADMLAGSASHSHTTSSSAVLLTAGSLEEIRSGKYPRVRDY